MRRLIGLLALLGACDVFDPPPIERRTRMWQEAGRTVHPIAVEHEGHCFRVDDAVACFVRFDSPLEALRAGAEPRADGGVFEVDRHAHVVVYHSDPATAWHLLAQGFGVRTIHRFPEPPRAPPP